MIGKWAILGAGGLGKEMAAAAADDDFVGFIDDGLAVGTSVGHGEVIGTTDDVKRGRINGLASIALGIGDRTLGLRLGRQLSGHVTVRTIVADGALIYGSIDEFGCYVAPGTIVGPGTQVGAGSLLNWRALVAHDCTLGSAVTVGPAAVVNGAVEVADRATIGAAATVLQGITIGRESMVAVGSAVLTNVAAGTTVLGVPARVIAKREVEDET